MSDIRVRIVPKSRIEPDFRREAFSLSVSNAKEAAPDLDRARETQKRLSEYNVEAHVTPKNAVDLRMDSAQVQEVFNVSLREESQEGADMAFVQGPALTTREPLSLPPALAEVAAFAYVPSPVQFYAPSFVPPSASVYHLRVADVVRGVRAALCHRQGWSGQGVRVAMSDTGFARHPWFDDHGFNIVRVSTPATSDPGIDTSGHGTGESANALAVAPDCEFIGVKHDDYSAMALETCLAQNPDVMTHSWGWNIDVVSKAQLQAQNPNQFFELLDVEQIVLDAIDDGVVVIFAAGNGHRAFPGCIPQVISAGGVTVQKDGALEASSYASSFTSLLYPGRQVPDFCGIVGESRPNRPLPGHIMLPVPHGCALEGENLPATQQDKGWGIFSGTSAAAPQIAGIAALILSANPNLTPVQVKQVLSDTARDVTDGSSAMGDPATLGVDAATGTGFVDAFAACMRASQMVIT